MVGYGNMSVSKSKEKSTVQKQLREYGMKLRKLGFKPDNKVKVVGNDVLVETEKILNLLKDLKVSLQDLKEDNVTGGSKVVHVVRDVEQQFPSSTAKALIKKWKELREKSSSLLVEEHTNG